MATYHAVAAVGQAIVQALSNACPKPEFTGAKFELVQAAQLQKPPFAEGISLYLYRVAVNTSVRNMGSRLGPDGKRRPAPVPLDLHYLLTAWAESAVKQQHLLAWAIRTLEDSLILPIGLLNSFGPTSETFRATETVELFMEPLTVQDMVNIWEVAKNNQQPSVAFLARMVGIESAVELIEPPAVQTRVFAAGEVSTP